MAKQATASPRIYSRDRVALVQCAEVALVMARPNAQVEESMPEQGTAPRH